MKVLERYPVVVFDMHGVLMFGHDRFDASQDFYRSYRAVGGRALSAAQVTRSILGCFEGMHADCETPARYDDFLPLREALQRYGGAPEAELDFLSLVFALHECGLVPDPCAELLSRLARTHRLGLVTNVWAPKHLWLREFERAGVSDLFTHMGFSSDSRSIKPSAKLFCDALRALHAEPEQVLFVGDSLRHDIEGAKRVGMKTAWVTSEKRAHHAADYIIESVLELEQICA